MRASRSLIAGIMLVFLAAPAFAKRCRCIHRDRYDAPPGDASRPEEPGSEPQRGSDPALGDPDTVLREAQNEYLNGDFAKAIELAWSVRASSASAATRAWRIIGAAACNIRDLKLVGNAYRHLDPNARQFIIYVCQRSWVVFSGGQFVLSDDAPAREVAPARDVPARELAPARAAAPVAAVAAAAPAPPPTSRLDVELTLLGVASTMLLGALALLLLRRSASLGGTPP